jgi:hypothetical protein
MKTPESLNDMEDSVLIVARNVFIMIKEMINAQEIPTGDQGQPNVLELQEEIDRIDVELLSRGLVPGGDGSR